MRIASEILIVFTFSDTIQSICNIGECNIVIKKKVGFEKKLTLSDRNTIIDYLFHESLPNSTQNAGSTVMCTRDEK